MQKISVTSAYDQLIHIIANDYRTRTLACITGRRYQTRLTDMLPENVHRLRLRPWIVEQINSGNYRGLDWIDPEKTEFKVPWKHAAKNDYDQEEDSKIFRAWSLHTGKYKVGIDKVEPAVWKTRLRTALNKLPDVEEVRDKKIRSPDGIPYRVYKLLPQRDHPWSRRDDEEDDEEDDDTEEGKIPSPKKRLMNVRKRRKSSHSSTDSSDSFVTMPTESKKARKENDFLRTHFKKRDTFRTFEATINPTKSLRDEIKDERDATSPPQNNSLKMTISRKKVFPDTLPVTSSNGLMVTATVAANGLPVAMTVVPTSHTTTSSSSALNKVNLPLQGTAGNSGMNGAVTARHDLRNAAPDAVYSIANDSKIANNIIVNGHYQPKPVPDFKPPIVNGIPHKLSPNNTILSSPSIIKSEPMTTAAVSHPFIQIPHIYGSSNGLILTHPTTMVTSLAQSSPQLVTVPTTFSNSVIPTTAMPPSIATMPSLLPTFPNSVVTASTQTRDEKPKINNSMPKIESVVSLGMIAAKLRENHKLSYSDAFDKAHFDLNIKHDDMEEQEEVRKIKEEDDIQPIPLNYVMRHGFGAELNSKYREGSSPHSDELLIEINYKSTKALKYQANNPKGCHLYYVSPIIREEAIEIEYGPLDADQVTFPDFNEFCMSDKQTKLTTTLLQHMDKGVLIYSKDGDVYLNRYGRTVIFWSTSQHENHEPEKTKRGERVKIFDHQKFTADLRNYFYHSGPCPATPKIYLGVGQQWSAKCPLKNNLVSIMVTPLTAMEEYISTMPTR
ncbi:uncharacterized protein LOC144438258 isoform X2 [Glandiceps talaboti]